MKICAGIGKMEKSDGYWENEDYIVTFAFGHLFELKSIEQYLNCEKGKWTMEQLPFFPEQFAYILKDDSGVKKQYGIIKKLYQRKDVTGVINAGDPDREGSVIILNILHELEKETGIEKPVERIWLTATTPEFVSQALHNLKPEEAYGNLYEEGLTRTYVDWLWGINFSRYVTLKTGGFFPVGRVLTPIVKFIYDRDVVISKFQKEIYYEIAGSFQKDGMEIKSKLKNVRFTSEQKKAGEQLCTDLFLKLKVTSELEAVVAKVESKEVTKNSPKLFSLDKLQNKMSKDYKYSSAETLELTQKLYEKGYVTYPRTNTEYLATAEKGSVGALLEKLSARENISLELRESKSIFDDSKIEGHTALIITEKELEGLSEKEENVYRTIKNRFICNFLKEKTILQETEVEIHIGEYVMELRGTAIVSEGFLKYEPIKSEKMLSVFKEGEVIDEIQLSLEEKTTKPPAHVNEAELNGFLKNPFKKSDMEEEEEDYKAILQGCEIGTVATRAGIIQNALRYEYIKKEKNAFFITDKGTAFIHALEQLGIDMEKTKTVEIGMDLKKVFRNEETLQSVVEKTKKEIAKVINSNRETDVQMERTSTRGEIGICPICGGNVMEGKKNYYCSNYREKNCGFVLWKVVAKKELTKDQIIQLLEKGKTSLIKGFTKNAGGTFSACLVLDEEGKVGFQFPKRKEKK